MNSSPDFDQSGYGFDLYPWISTDNQNIFVLSRKDATLWIFNPLKDEMNLVGTLPYDKFNGGTYDPETGDYYIFVPATDQKYTRLVKITSKKNTIAAAWRHAQNDLAGTNHYVNSSPVQTGNNLKEKFILSGTGGNVLTGDVTGDGFLEIVHVSGDQLNIFNYQGTLIQNVTLGSSDCTLSLIADVNDDGIDDIGIGTNKTGSLKTWFYDGSGTLLQTLSKTAGSDSYMRPAGLTGSGDFIISFTSGYSHDNQYRGFAVYDKTTGQEKWNYKVGPASWLSSIADFDNDGILEFTNIASTTHNGCTASGVDGTGTTTTDGDIWLIVVDENGNELFSKKYPSPSDGSAKHHFVDLNKDGQMQILGFESHGSSYYHGTSQVHLYDQAGTIVNTFNGQEDSSWSYAVADMTGNGMDEVVAVSSVGDSHMLYVLDTGLTELDSLAVDGRVQLVSDINGDGNNEIVLLSTSGTITVLDNNLTVLNTYELGTYGRVIASDLDNNGKLELIGLTDGIHVLENSDTGAGPDQYMVVFKDHDGTILKTETVNHGNEATSPSDPVREGFVFTGWDTAFDNVSYDLVVTAQYDPVTYTVSYVAGENGIITGQATQTVNHGENTTEVTAVPNTGYHFVEWTDGITANPRTDENITDHLTVTAEFIINQYNVIFQDHDGTALKIAKVDHENDAEAPDDPVRPGYVFIGWNVVFDNVTRDLTVTAQYSRLTYTVTYLVGDNGSIVGPTPQTIPHGDSSEVVTAEPDTGYHFVQWSDGSEANPRIDHNITGPVDVTAEFAINQYTVTIDSTEGGSTDQDGTHSIDHGGSITINPTPGEGYHFTGWSGDAAGTASPLTVADIIDDRSITANFELNQYTVTFVDHNGTELKVETVVHGSGAKAPADPEQEGHTFTGWDMSYDIITDDLTVTALYDILTYQATYTAGDNGTITGPTPQTVKHGEDSVEVTAEPDTGYHFVQWSDGSKANPRIDESVTSNISISAVFVYVKGDVNIDGMVDMKDAILLIQYATGQTDLTSEQKKRGNISGHEDDNQVGLMDAERIFNIMIQNGSFESHETPR